MNCPVDQTPLREREKENVIIDVCPTCRGIWLDHGELEKLVDIESERSGRYREDYDDDDDDDDRNDRRDRDYGADGQPRRKRGFLRNLMDSFGD